MGIKQLGFGDYEQSTATKRTRRERFLAEMEAVVPWQLLIDLIEPHYPKTSSKGGRPPYPLETMLRVHLMQQWYDLSDPAMEDALIEVEAAIGQAIPGRGPERHAGMNVAGDDKADPGGLCLILLGLVLLGGRRSGDVDKPQRWLVERGEAGIEAEVAGEPPGRVWSADAVEHHGAGVGGDEADRHADGGGLAGAVGADEAIDPARPQIEGDAVHGPQRTEIAREVAYREDHVQRSSAPAGAANADATVSRPAAAAPDIATQIAFSLGVSSRGSLLKLISMRPRGSCTGAAGGLRAANAGLIAKKAR
jgi:IS5 family transposase